jgi:hypothetical protein
MDDHRPDFPRSFSIWEWAIIIALVVIVVILFIVVLVPQQASMFSHPNYAIPYPYVTDTPYP